MAELLEIVHFCDERVYTSSIADFAGALNGLQVANRKKITKIGAAVDAGKAPFEKAVAAGVDFLIVHHGLFWGSPQPVTDVYYEKLRLLIDHECALYSSHLPLDCHPEIGNNALIAKNLGLKTVGTFSPYEGNDIGVIAALTKDRMALNDDLKALFPSTFKAIEFGSEQPEKIGILSGSGAGCIDHLIQCGIDTLITGELRQNHFNLAQELKLNLYPCGHYATEIFGVRALAAEVAEKFQLPWEFIATDCFL